MIVTGLIGMTVGLIVGYVFGEIRGYSYGLKKGYAMCALDTLQTLTGGAVDLDSFDTTNSTLPKPPSGNA